jgi:hypothetical protein
MVAIMTPEDIVQADAHGKTVYDYSNIVTKKRSYQIAISSLALWTLAQWIFAIGVIKVHSFHFWRFNAAAFLLVAATIRKVIVTQWGLNQVAQYATTMTAGGKPVPVEASGFMQTDVLWGTSLFVFVWYHILDGWDAIAPGGDSERGPSATLQNANWDVAPYVKVPAEDEEYNAKVAAMTAAEFERGLEAKHAQLSTGNEDWGSTIGHLKAVFEIDERIKFLHPDLRVGFFKEPAKYDAIVRINATTKTEARLSLRVFLPNSTPESSLLLNNLPSVSSNSNEENVPLRSNGAASDGKAERVADFLFAEDLKEFFGVSCEAMTSLLQLMNKPPEWGKCRLLCHLFRNINTFLKMAGLRDRQEDRTMVEGCLPRTGIWGKRYYGGLPFRVGPGGCKWGLLPRQRNHIGKGPERSTVEDSNDTKSFGKSMKVADDRYKGEAEAFLTDKDAVFDFSVQIATDEQFHDFKKAEAIWAEDLSPYFGIGTLTIPKGQKMVMGEKEGLIFSVHNNLKEHRPIGAVNNARAEVYKRHGGARAKVYGQCPVTRLTGLSHA